MGGACYRCRVEWRPKASATAPPPARFSPGRSSAPQGTGTQTRWKSLLKRSLRWIPPVRLVWIFLGIMIWAGGAQTATSEGLEIWFSVLGLAVGLDMMVQVGRYGRKVRFPDAALAIGMFLVILIVPSSTSVFSGSTTAFWEELLSVTAATVVIRHLLRQNGRPWFNPTALGLALGYVLFALPVPWGVGAWPGTGNSASALEMYLTVIFGIALVIRQRNTWRFPAFFFLAAIPLQAIMTVSSGGQLDSVTLSQVIVPPLTIFYGLWMVPEPRTAPSAPKHMWRFALLVGAVYVLLGTFWQSHDPVIAAQSSWSAIDPFVALFAGNFYAVLSRKVKLKKPTRAEVPLSIAAAQPWRTEAFGTPMFYGGFDTVGAPGPNPPPLPGGW